MIVNFHRFRSLARSHTSNKYRFATSIGRNENPRSMKILVFLVASPVVLGFVSQGSFHRGGNRQLFSSNPFTSMIGDMASSIFGNADGIAQDEDIETKLNSIGTKTWPDLKDQLATVQTPEEKSFRNNLSKGYGVGSPLHLVRLFDETNREEDIRVTFYRDSASWCK